MNFTFIFMLTICSRSSWRWGWGTSPWWPAGRCSCPGCSSASQAFFCGGLLWPPLTCQFHPVRAICGPKQKIARREKKLMRSRRNQYFILKYGPQHAFWCDIGKIWDDSFWGNALFCIPYFGPKWPFFGPEGPNLAQNIKNIVWQVVLTQNMTSQSQNWSRVEMDNFGFSRPPKTPRGPSRAPRGPQESKNGPNHQ